MRPSRYIILPVVHPEHGLVAFSLAHARSPAGDVLAQAAACGLTVEAYLLWQTQQSVQAEVLSESRGAHTAT